MDVLIIGNGFDLAHGLKTQYSDFLPIIKSPDAFVDAITRMKRGSDVPEMWEKYRHEGISDASIDNINEMSRILKQNVWAYYFSHCEADIQGWIDFEHEIFPAISLFQEIFKNAQNATVGLSGDTPVLYVNIGNNELLRRAGLFPKYISYFKDNPIHIKGKPFVGIQYGLVKKSVLDSLRHELDDFIKVFKIYLNEIVCSTKIDRKPIIESIHADAIISFNYTNTEQQYDNLKKANTFHIHGNVLDKDSIVLGVDEVKSDTNKDFIYFVKYFQRIRKKTNQEYKSLLNCRSIGENLNLIFYGHSLDSTDKDIIKTFVDTANHVSIYYKDQDDYEKKVINLIKLFGRDDVEDDLYSGRIEMIEIT